MAETILPGTYVTVKDEGLITAGQVISGYIGIVGTASKGPTDERKILGSLSEAREIFGDADSRVNGNEDELTLIRSLEQIYANGGSTVYAVRARALAPGAGPTAAAYEVRDDQENVLLTLEAKTPGTWGNEIQIRIEVADEGAIVSEKLKVGDPENLALRRSNIDTKSQLNSIRVRKGSNNQVRSFTITYDTSDVVDTSVVIVDTKEGSKGALRFADGEVKSGDVILARYHVMKDQSRKVTLSHRETTENYLVADAPHLAEQIRASSALVTTPEKHDDYDVLLAEVASELGDDPERFKAHKAGTNGRAPSADDYNRALEKLENEPVNIVLLAGQSSDSDGGQMVTKLVAHLERTAQIKRERIGLIGSGDTKDASVIVGATETLAHDRLIFVAPGLQTSSQENLPGAYTAAAVAGLISALPVQASPTNKTLVLPGLAAVFNSSELELLVSNRVLAVEQRNGYRVVKGITTSTNPAWHQVTTRRIVDYATFGVRSACDPYIGKLNNERVRGAMKATLDAFLTRMVDEEALVSYELEVSATRVQESAGEAIVTLVLQPTFSIDFVKVTMYLG